MYNNTLLIEICQLRFLLQTSIISVDQQTLPLITFSCENLKIHLYQTYTKLQKQETGRSPSVPVSYFCMIKSFYLSPFLHAQLVNIVTSLQFSA